jgi:hypothetical protein
LREIISNGHSDQEKNYWSNQKIVVSFVSFSLALIGKQNQYHCDAI